MTCRRWGGWGRWWALVVGAVLMPVGALACLWDSDTLRAEARGLPGLVDLLTGRFEREPARYYEMRLERVAAEVERRPDDLGLYDDAGVACDRLGRCDEAIAWMAWKRARLDAMGSGGGGDAEHEYRYLANLGTFHAHRWLARGADREDTSDLALGRDLIARAIELNPEAHFGRERFQLMAIEWMLEPIVEDVAWEQRELSSIFDHRAGYRGAGRNALGLIGDITPDEAVEGLSGLIALGAAWESIDIIHSLALALESRGDHAMARVADLRCLELARDGRGSRDPHGLTPAQIVDELDGYGGPAMSHGEVESWYPRARARADEWKAHRDAFMAERFEQGMHPDTHPGFWDGYVPIAALAPPNGVFGLAGYRLTVAVAGLVAGVVVVGLAGVLVWPLWRRRRARAEPRA